MSEYRQLVMNQDISHYVTTFMQHKVGTEMETPIQCVISKEKITFPVRHRGIKNIKCVIDLDTWVEYQQSLGLNDLSSCPGCKADVKLSDYGVDYKLCNAIAMLQHSDRINQKFSRDKLVAMYSQNKFYGILKKDPSIKIPLPGCSAILSLQRQNTLNIQEAISQTTDKMGQYLIKKKFQAIERKLIDFNKVNDQLSLRALEIQNVIKQNCKFIQIGKQSITANDFVFALQKSQSSSILVIYYPHYNIWIDFELFQENGEPYLQLEQALYIKNSTQEESNFIYIIGGSIQQFEQSNQFLQIQIQKDPYTKITKLTVQKMPDLLQNGYNYQGTYYKGYRMIQYFNSQIFIFYGQKKFVNRENHITDELLNVAQFFKNNKWSTLDVIPVPRFDGSYFTIDHKEHGKCIIFFGGVSANPDGLQNCFCQQQKKGQIFLCEKGIFYKNDTFELKYEKQEKQVKQDKQEKQEKQDKQDKQENVVNSTIFSIPYFKEKQLFISGEYLKLNLNGKRQIYTFDWYEGTMILNQLFSLQPPEQILTPVSYKVANGMKIFTPVQDCEGCVLYGNFYTIHQYEEPASAGKKNSIVQLLSINQTNGLFNIIPYQDRAKTQQINKQRIEDLQNTVNNIIQID